MHNPATLRIIARAGLWSALAFVLNLTWEIADVRLYTIWARADGMSVTWALLHCSLGDVVIALAMFALAGIVLWCADWPASRPWVGGVILVIGAMGCTAGSEWYNVYRAGNWSYTASMPMVVGIGLSPLLQWLLLPPVIVVAYRALLPVLFGDGYGQPSNGQHRLRAGCSAAKTIIEVRRGNAHSHAGGCLSLVGGLWYMAILCYNISIAVWVEVLIALARGRRRNQCSHCRLSRWGL